MASYQQLLLQATQIDLPSLKSQWNSVLQAVSSDSPNDSCQGLGGPASLVPALQQISSLACTIAHNAATAAMGYSLNCIRGGNAGASYAQNAQSAVAQACSLSYSWLPVYGPYYGTTQLTGEHGATCLDVSFMNAVGTQVSAAEYAVAQAQGAYLACLPSAAQQAASFQGGAAAAAAQAAAAGASERAPLVTFTRTGPVFSIQRSPVQQLR